MFLGDFNAQIGRHIDGFDGVHGGYGVGLRYLEERMLLEFFLKKELCVPNTWFKREGENEMEIDFVLMKKEQ